MNFEKKTNMYRSFMIVLVTVMITFIVTSLFFYNYFLKTDNGVLKTVTKYETSDLDTKMNLLKLYVDKYYLNDVNDEKMKENALKGYISGLGDEYTEYLTEDEYDSLMIDVNGDYVGIGVYITEDRYGNAVILLPIKGSPAEEAGLKSGDIIVKVDGEDCSEMELTVLSNKIKGEEGTKVDLEIKRDEETINKTIIRRTVILNEIESEVINNDIGYIKMVSFNDGSAEEFKKHLEDVLSKNVNSLIIDLRDNGGGVVTEVTDIAEFFIEKDKTIMIEKDKTNNKNEIKSETDPIVNSKIKICVLINENSASATEMLVGALKDNNIAKVIGKKSYGKGVMQEVVPVSFGGALKVTIKEFLTPNGSTINKKGIEPDIEVENKSKTNEDEQLQKAIELLK